MSILGTKPVSHVVLYYIGCLLTIATFPNQIRNYVRIILCYNIMCTVSFEFSAAVVGNSFHYYYSKYIKRYICILKFNRFHHLNLGSNQLILYTLITETNPLKGVSRNPIMKYSYIIPVSCDSLELLVCIQM